MRRTLTALAFCALLTTSAAAQDPATAGDPRPFDSFGDILITDWKARLDNFAAALKVTPGSKAYVVAYSARNKFIGYPLRRAYLAARYLRALHQLAEELVEVVNGGYRDGVTFELWAAPPGAELPVKPLEYSLMMAGEKAPVPFDRVSVVERSDPYFDHEEIYGSRLDSKELYEPFMTALRSDPGLRGCVIAYTPRGGRRGADRKFAARVKTGMAKLFPLDVGRVVAVGGGRRDEKLIELWLVPPGAELPKPTPTRRSRRRSR